MPLKKVKHPNLFEVNTRVLLSRYKKGSRRATLGDIPDSYWQKLSERGMHWVWLMGVWTLKEKQINPNLIPDNMLAEFKTLLPDLTDEDIDGSTYAIDDYEVDPIIGGEKELRELRSKLSNFGICLMLDFVPNHYGAHTKFIHLHPEHFIEFDINVIHDNQLNDSIGHNTIYSPLTQEGSYFAHGKDPYFEAWQDTIQVNYASESTREWMTSQLLKVATLCDGVRCDMAMLPVKRIFEKTWDGIIKWDGGEFWDQAIKHIKDPYPDFIFLAEVYWGMEAELLNMGFDYCYDKTFYDKLTDPHSLQAHYQAEEWYLIRTARFLENHDEPRIASRLQFRQHMAAAALVAFGPGMRFWHMGQWEGLTQYVPVQLTRAPLETCGCLMGGFRPGTCGCLDQFYTFLLQMANLRVFTTGDWSRIDIDSDLQTSLFLWQWKDDAYTMTIAVNYGDLEILIDPERYGLTSANFEKSVCIEKPDSYKGLKLNPWDIRMWEMRN